MINVTILKGLPASGKTTWANREIGIDTVRINKDDIRKMIHGEQYVDEKQTLVMRDSLIRSALLSGKNVIVDDTNLNPIHERSIRRIVSEVSANRGVPISVGVKCFNASLQDCITRDMLRGPPGHVGTEVITKMYNRYLRNAAPLEIVYDVNKRDCVICDLDGTLALYGTRNPYDASTCGKDEYNTIVASAIKGVLDTSLDADVVFLSGRDEKYRPQTLAWLKQHCPDWTDTTKLYMRPTGDREADEKLKKGIALNILEPKYNVLCAFDDRLKVVRMWSSIGVFCFCVNQGLCEF